MRLADTFRARAKGLLGTPNLEQGEGLLLMPCRSIHSFGMRFVFDAIYLTPKCTVLHIINHMPARRCGPVLRHASAVLELPAGTIFKSATSVYDQLVIHREPIP